MSNLNPESLCAKCEHLKKSEFASWYVCYHRNNLQLKYDCVCIDRGFKSCVNFKPKQTKQQ